MAEDIGLVAGVGFLLVASVAEVLVEVPDHGAILVAEEVRGAEAQVIVGNGA